MQTVDFKYLPLHPGEVAFPGGKREHADRTTWATAQREAMEEVGLPGEMVVPLGELEPLVTRTGFEVHPCIARVPPDFNLVPPAPGAPRPAEGTASEQALEALFGGPAPRSDIETSALDRAGSAAPSIRSTIGDPETNTVAKGRVTRDIIAAPEGDGQNAQTLIPG